MNSKKHLQEIREASFDDSLAIADCLSVLSDAEKDALIVALSKHALVFQHALWNSDQGRKLV